jgi:hypothetical protein
VHWEELQIRLSQSQLLALGFRSLTANDKSCNLPDFGFLSCCTVTVNECPP